MTSKYDDDLRDLAPNQAQRMLIETYRRLLQLPRQADGMRFATIATIATYELRLMDLQLPGRVDKCSLWVELLDLATGRSIDSRGCRDLDEAGAAARYFIASARRYTKAN